MNESFIWKKLINAGLSPAGAAGLMGNLYAESALNPKNLQNSYEKSLRHTDESYTNAVDSGIYNNFVHDSAGYGLAQWTFWTRKQGLLKHAQKNKKSIGDLETQIEFLVKELKEDFKEVWSVLTSTTDVRTASNNVLIRFESPADQGTEVKEYRYSQSIKFYNMFHKIENIKSAQDIAKEIISGKWGNGEERKKNIENAGYDYKEVQDAVNFLLSENASKDRINVTVTIRNRNYSGILQEE